MLREYNLEAIAHYAIGLSILPMSIHFGENAVKRELLKMYHLAWAAEYGEESMRNINTAMGFAETYRCGEIYKFDEGEEEVWKRVVRAIDLAVHMSKVEDTVSRFWLSWGPFEILTGQYEEGLERKLRFSKALKEIGFDKMLEEELKSGRRKIDDFF